MTVRQDSLNEVPSPATGHSQGELAIPFFLRILRKKPGAHIGRNTSPLAATVRHSLARLFCAVLLPACATPHPLPAESEPVVNLMAERLRLAQEVAWVKWRNNLPIHDPQREAGILEKLARQGERAGIDEALLVRFLRAQMEASRMEQEAWMSKWRRGAPLPAGEPPSLESLRVRLDRLSALLLAEWAATPTTPRVAAAQHLSKSVLNPRSATVAASGFVVSD